MSVKFIKYFLKYVVVALSESPRDHIDQFFLIKIS